METSDEHKRKHEDVVREISDALESAFTVKDIEGARAILFHDLGKAGLTVDEALAVIQRPDPTSALENPENPVTIFAALCERMRGMRPRCSR